MMTSLPCVADESLNDTVATSILETLCGTSSQNCPALHGDGSTGTYGAYSMCNVTARLSWALNVKYKDNSIGCNNDPFAVVQTGEDLYECNGVLDQAGAFGTGTITSFASFTTATQGATWTNTPTFVGSTYWDDSSSLSQGAIAGIVIGSLLGVAAIASGCVWFFCLRKRRFKRQKVGLETKDIDHQDSQDLNLCPPPGMQRGSVSMLSMDSRDMSELPPFDGSYMQLPSTQWSRTELNSSTSEIPAGYGSVSERDAAISDMHSPVSRNLDLGTPSPISPPSPMGSDKELPAFRTRMEDKSLPSMKLLSPMIKVSPVPPVDRTIRRKPV
jgi:hypothetical protein